MPTEPIGTRPSSTLWPDKRPATTPADADANRDRCPEPADLGFVGEAENAQPKTGIEICSSAPRNQNQVLPRTVNQSRRSRFSARIAPMLSPNGSQRNLSRRLGSGVRPIPKLAKVPTTAIAMTIAPSSAG